MNNRIKELVDLAGFVRFSPEEDPYTPIDWSSDYSLELEKFAELIVKECMLCCERAISDPVRDEINTFEQGGAYCIGEIMYHFGV